MAFNITDIQGRLTRGGARPALFQIGMTIPTATGTASQDLPFLCRAAQMPASTIGMIEVPYFGRKIKLAGDRTFAEWTITVIQEENFRLRHAFENWSNAINSHVGNVRGFGSPNPNQYKTVANVDHFGKTGNKLRTYNFYGMFPTEVSPVDLDWNTTDTLEEFTVTFQYDYWDIPAKLSDVSVNINAQVGPVSFGGGATYGG